MSRETDTPSSGPQGRGGSAYPSGTPPYGTESGGPDAERDADRMEAAAPAADEPETQTTLTTRIRINIPGSRPIPPVVMRTPVNEEQGEAPSSPSSASPSPSSASASAPFEDIPGVPKAHPAPAPEPAPEEPAAADSGGAKGEEKTSDWFAPRKPAGGGKAAGASGGAGGPGGHGGAGGPGGPGAAGAPGPGTAAPGAPAQGTPPRGDLPYRKGGPGQGGGPAQGGEPTRPRSALSDLAEGAGPSAPTTSPSGPHPGAPGTPGRGPAGGPPPRGPLGGPNGPNGPRPTPPGVTAPSGPTTGPATGEGAPPPTPFRRPAVPSAPGPQGPGASGPQGPGASGPQGPGPQQPDTPAYLREGSEPPRMSDDTAVLTPQKPAPAPAPIPAPGQVSGATLNSGLATPPPGQDFEPSPFAPQGSSAGADEPAQPAPAAPAASSRPAKKGRSKLVLVASGVLGLLGVAYGAGLLMNHSDVPKGTTVLGVDIGGGTRDDAVEKLDAALGERTTQPLELSVNGKKVILEPEQAGLSLDAQATVRAAAGSDYNPVSVIGSLFGGERVVEAEMPVDEEKLTDALQRIAGDSSGGEGGIKLSPGKATPVYGKGGTKVNEQGAIAVIEAAYREQVETGRRTPVELPVSTAAPKVTKAEVDRMMKEFATPAMSGLITIRAESGESIPFSPEKSIYKFVKVVATEDGKLTEQYDAATLKEMYGSTFDNVLITRGNGEQTAVTEQDVIGAIRQALRGKTPAERTVTIQSDPS
ncbi:hypothetical protein [Streptomyces sp. KLOTTS4A1]|uniref:hypothetical protein n=1 Tax=Streptomyces sp. KLOTTS4A1 TaxID=3390996 RepID=UPI0039F49D7A